MKTKLQVKDLTISFRTTNGKVQAVRRINFDLNEGETLAIVGESGSGKSVTSKAILGILAGNSIIEGGEIIYDGQDLLKITEEDFHKIRGDKIAMIFQDPMSSLNPIVKIGRQLTEAMILKGKARQKESRSTFNSYLKTLKEAMVRYLAAGDSSRASELELQCKNFDKFEYKHLELEGSYVKAHEAAVEAVDDIKVLSFEIEKNAAKDVNYRVGRIKNLANTAIEKYVVNADADSLKNLTDSLSGLTKQGKTDSYAALNEALKKIQGILETAIAYDEPNFFGLGYYLTFSNEPLPEGLTIQQMNEYTHNYLDSHFMLGFIDNAEKTLRASAADSYKNKQATIDKLRALRPAFEKDALVEDECKQALKEFKAVVNNSIDALEISKDNLVYTFISGFSTEVDKYFNGIVKNKKEKARFEKQTARWEAKMAKGKEPDWKVVPASYTDLVMVKENMLHQIDRLVSHYEEVIAQANDRDYRAEAIAIVDFLKENAAGVVHKVTKRMAHDKAIKLMEEVGIPEPRRRYNQYPFEFSGGMRQRIVIAIALAANPDILICDEPTTALDVTIQSQILELINKLKAERHISVIFITHDLGVVANMADRIAVMYAGKIVEYGTAADVFYHAAHPYTWALLASMPDLDTNEKLEAIPGTPPNMIYPPVGDAFAARNKYAMQIDFEQQPPMFQISDTHYAATWLLHPDAPKVEPPKTLTDRIARMKAKREAQQNGNAE